jgi:putative hydrolase of the HAD superfamily
MNARPAVAVLLDLDETLVVEEASVAAAFLATAETAARAHDLDAAALAVEARRVVREIWFDSEHRDDGRRIGVSSWEVAGGALLDRGPELVAFTERLGRDAWGRALGAQGVRDAALAAELAARYAGERDARHVPFDDAAPALTALRERGNPLAVVTNGASRSQRRKLEAAGLASLVDEVVVSGEVGSAKPDRVVFEAALAALGAPPGAAVMVGDSLRKDVAGAQAAGLRGVWLDREGRGDPGDVRPDLVLAGLAGLPAAVS